MLLVVKCWEHEALVSATQLWNNQADSSLFYDEARLIDASQTE